MCLVQGMCLSLTFKKHFLYSCVLLFGFCHCNLQTKVLSSRLPFLLPCSTTGVPHHQLRLGLWGRGPQKMSCTVYCLVIVTPPSRVHFLRANRISPSPPHFSKRWLALRSLKSWVNIIHLGEFAKALPRFWVYSALDRPLTSQVFVQWLYLLLDLFWRVVFTFLKSATSFSDPHQILQVAIVGTL